MAEMGTRKLDKRQARYVERYAGTLNKFCDRCIHFREPESCLRVWGRITPRGSCKLWEKKHESVTVAVSISGTERAR